MAIRGTDEKAYQANYDVNSQISKYVDSVGQTQGATVKDHNDYFNKYHISSKQAYESDTVAGKYVLKGKAGITANFYTAFSNAFDEYEAIIKSDLGQLQTNPNIKQAFSGTDIERAVKKLIEAVKAEAEDYLFKLEVAEKTVINSVKQAFNKQQREMQVSMHSDTRKLNGEGSINSTADEQKSFAAQDKSWQG